jgi:hypothetical protein
LTKARMTYTLMATAHGLLRILAAMRAPCSVKARTCFENLSFRKDITVCDIPRISSRVKLRAHAIFIS